MPNNRVDELSRRLATVIDQEEQQRLNEVFTQFESCASPEKIQVEDNYSFQFYLESKMTPKFRNEDSNLMKVFSKVKPLIGKVVRSLM